MIIPLCERFHRLPSEILAEDVRLYRLLAIYDEAHPPEVRA